MKTSKMFFAVLMSLLVNVGAYAQSSVNNSALNTQQNNNKAKNTNNTVGALNFAAAGVCAATCFMAGTGCCSMAPVFALMGMQNKKQASENGDVAGQAGLTYAMTDIGAGVGYDPSAVDALNRDPEISAGNRFGSTLADGAKVGTAVYDAKTNSMKLPDGKTIKGSDLSSPAAMAAAGFSQSVIDQVSAKQKEFEAKANAKLDKYGLNKMIVNGDEGGGGGGGGSSSAVANNNEGLYGGAAKAHSGLGVSRDPAQVAGMQKDFNGEPIGVAGDNLFRMMTRRYKVKESQSSFLDESALLQK